MISNKNDWGRDTVWNVPHSWFKAKSISSLVNTCLFSVSLVSPQLIAHFFFNPIWETYLLKCPHQSAKDTLSDRVSASFTEHKHSLVWGMPPTLSRAVCFLACLTTQVQFGIFILPSSFYWDNGTTFRELSTGQRRDRHGTEQKVNLLLNNISSGFYLSTHLVCFVSVSTPQIWKLDAYKDMYPLS